MGERNQVTMKLLNIIARAITHIIVLMITIWFFWLVLGRFGVSEILSVGLGIAFAFAPGVYDYLGRDILGAKIEDTDPFERDDPFIKFRKGKYTRDKKEGLNASDFIFISRILKKRFHPLVGLVADLDLKKWRSIDPESELAAAVLETMDDEIEETQHWSKGKQLPFYPLFLLDVFESLKRELSVDYIFPEEKSADILERKHSRKDNYH